jgi:hypothetical protein
LIALPPPSRPTGKHMPEFNLYYFPPPDEQFDELKAAAIELWKKVDTDNDKYGYATDKINRIKDLENVGGNFMTIVAMFDWHNQNKLALKLSPETRSSVRERMIAGGNPEYFIPF